MSEHVPHDCVGGCRVMCPALPPCSQKSRATSALRPRRADSRELPPLLTCLLSGHGELAQDGVEGRLAHGRDAPRRAALASRVRRAAGARSGRVRWPGALLSTNINAHPLRAACLLGWDCLFHLFLWVLMDSDLRIRPWQVRVRRQAANPKIDRQDGLLLQHPAAPSLPPPFGRAKAAQLRPVVRQRRPVRPGTFVALNAHTSTATWSGI